LNVLSYIFTRPRFAVSIVEGVESWQYRVIHWCMRRARTHLLSDAALQSWYRSGK